jgi:hypothetical protein
MLPILVCISAITLANPVGTPMIFNLDQVEVEENDLNNPSEVADLCMSLTGVEPRISYVVSEENQDADFDPRECLDENGESTCGDY